MNKYRSFISVKECLKYLKGKGFLKPGIIIPTSIFEFLIGMKASDSWSWRGPFLTLKEAIEKEGFFCTQRNLADEDLKLLAPDEVWIHSKKRQESRKKRVDKDHSIVQKTDTSSLDGETFKKHMHELRKLAQATLRLAEIIHMQ